jgi:redox-sensing transcriptional repressor
MPLSEQPRQRLKHTLLERLVHYYHFLSDRLEHGNGETVTSTEIAALVNMDDTLVRKDLAAIGVRGLPRVGFKAAEVVTAIRELLAFDRKTRAVIIGMGRLGGAFASYPGFARYGLEVCGLFDSDPIKVGLMSGGLVVLPIDRLPLVVGGKGVGIAMLTVPPEAAQEVADLAVSAGIKAIWNFASTNVRVPEGVYVRHEHIAAGLAELSYSLRCLETDSGSQASAPDAQHLRGPGL